MTVGEWWESAPIADNGGDDWWAEAPLAEKVAPTLGDKNAVRDLIGVDRIPGAGNRYVEAAMKIPMRLGQLGAQALRAPVTLQEGLMNTLGIDGDKIPGSRMVRDALSAPARMMGGVTDDMDAVGYAAPKTSIDDVIESLNPRANVNRAKAAAEFGEPGNYNELTKMDRLGNVADFIGHGALSSAADMAGAVTAPWTYFTGYADEAARSRAKNDGRDGAPTLGDVGIGAADSAVQTLFERWATSRMFPGGTPAGAPGLLPALGRIAKETGVQSGTEFLQEAFDEASTTLGTEKGGSWIDIAKAGLGGALIGGPMGTGAQGIKEVFGSPAPVVPPPVDIVGGRTGTPEELAADAALVDQFNARGAEPVMPTGAIDVASLPPLGVEPAPLAEAPPDIAPLAEGIDLDALMQNLPPEVMDALSAALGTEPVAQPGMVPPPSLDPAALQDSGVPVMVTQKMRSDLSEMGITPAEISGMTPQVAWDILNSPLGAVDGRPDATTDGVLRSEPALGSDNGASQAPVGLGQVAGEREADSRGTATVPSNIAPASPQTVEAAANMRQQSAIESAKASAIPKVDIKPTPEPRYTAQDMRALVGWSQRGGEMVRAPADQSILNEDERSGKVDAMPKGEVIGRTKWVGFDGPDGQPSSFWKNRPVKFTPEQANQAFDKYERGEKLSKPEQRFIDYAQATAQDYDQAMQLLDDAELGYSEVERQEGHAAMREQLDADIAEADQSEAFSTYELARRASESGVDAFDIAPSSNESQPAYAARLWNLIKEADRGTDARTAQENRGLGETGREGGQEPVSPNTEARTPQVGLFGAPKASDYNDAARRAKDDARDGKTGTGSTSMLSGKGELFAGNRPAQMDVEDAKPAELSPREKRLAKEANVPSSIIAARDAADARVRAASAAMDGFPKSAMGLTDDAVKATPEWRKAKSEMDRSMESARTANAAVVKAMKAKPQAPLESVESAPQTESAAFKKWFGDSKVVDENGKPLVVYHGTTNADKIIDAGFKPGWVHLTDSRPVADSYQDWNKGGNSGTLEVFVKAENPAFYDAGGKKYTDIGNKVFRATWDAEKAGHDALIIKNVRDNYDSSTPTNPHNTYVVFKPTQIKSATGNNGNFDASNPSILENTDSDADWLANLSEDESRTGGDFDADKFGLRAAVEAVLGKTGAKVEYLRGYEGLPKSLRDGVNQRNSLNRQGVTAALYDPNTTRVFIFTNVIKTPEAAAWNAAHEIAGHHGLRKLLGDKLNPALEIAKQNPTVAAIAKELGRQRKLTPAQDLLAVEEALAELAGAIKTDDWAKIKTKYGVDVPVGIRTRVVAAIDNFLKRLKALFAAQGTTFKDADVRALLEAAWQAADGQVVGSMDAAPESALDALESVEFSPETTNGRDVIANGRWLSLIDAAKAAGLDLTDLDAAVAAKDSVAAVTAIDTLLAAMRKPERVTGTKNAVTDAERAAANRDPILREAVKGNEETVYEAMRTMQGDPLAGPEAVARLNRGGVEGISLQDEAVMLVYKTQLMNERDAAAKKLTDPNASEDAKAVARTAWEQAEMKIAALDEAAVNAGREWGRFGQFRQRMMKADFTLEALERKERARLERPLTQAESATIKAMADTIADLQAKVDKLQVRASNAASEVVFENTVKRMRQPRRTRTLESLRSAADEARARIRATASVPSRRGQSGAVMSPTIFADYATIGAYHVANGANTLAEWVAAMTADIGDAFRQLKADHPKIFGAAKAEAAKPIKADATVAEVMSSIDKANVKPKDVKKLVEALVGEGLRGEPDVIGAAADKLGMSESEVRALFVQSEPRAKQTKTEIQAEIAELRKIVRLENEIERLEAGLPKPPRGQAAPDSPAVAAKKQELADLRKSLKPIIDPEARYQEMRGKQIQKRIADLNQRITDGDFAARPRVPRALSDANQRAMFNLDKAKMDFARHQHIEMLKARSKWGKALGFVGDTFNLSRAVMTSIDLSGLLRQGGFVTFGRPVMAGKAFARTLPALFSENAEHRVMNEIKQRANAPLYRKFKLALTSIGSGPLSQVEEAYATRWVERFELKEGQPIRNKIRTAKDILLAPVRGSGRVYAAFLNQLRADTFDALAATLTKTGVPTEAEGKWIADFVNTATGRGAIWGKNDNAGELVNAMAFAPRLVASRFSIATGTPIWTAPTGRTMRLVAMEYARFLTGIAVASSMLVAAMGDDDEDFWEHFTFDPRSSDFMKLRFGNTRVDMFTGLSQVSVLMSRIVSGETIGKDGKVKPVRPVNTLNDLRRWAGEDIPAHKQINDEGKLAFGLKGLWDVMTDFMRSKFAPVPGAGLNMIVGTDFNGDIATLRSQAQQLSMPLTFGDIYEVMEDQGIPRGTALSVLALAGASMQVYPGQSPLQATDAARTDIKERLMKVKPDQWQSELDKMTAEYGPIMDGVTLDIYKADGKGGKAGEVKTNADGAPKLKTQRLSDDDPSSYRDNYRQVLRDRGMDDGQIKRYMDTHEIHHIIADNVVRAHPLMIVARKSGFSLNEPANLVGLAGKKSDETSKELGHKTAHPRYDRAVSDELDAAERLLKRKHGSIDKAPRSEIFDAVRKVERVMRQKIESRDVPTKDGRLAVEARDARQAV